MKLQVTAPFVKAVKGFTLIELLVVLMIIGLMFTVVTLTVSFDEGEQLDTEAELLLDMARLAEDRSVLTGEPLGLRFVPPGAEPGWTYHWLRYRGGQWLDAGAPLDSRQLAENIELSLEVEGEQVLFERLNDDNGEIVLPNIVFFPGGEVTPFYLTLFDAQEVDDQRILSSRRTGRVETEEDDL